MRHIVRVLDWSDPDRPEGVALDGCVVQAWPDGVDVSTTADGEARTLRFGLDGWAAGGLFSVAQADVEAAMTPADKMAAIRQRAERGAWARLVKTLGSLRLDEPSPDDAPVNVAAARLEIAAALNDLRARGVDIGSLDIVT